MIQPWQGSIEVASDKSLSHRALLFSALAEGESRIDNVLAGEDVLRTLKILNQLGVNTVPSADEIFKFNQSQSAKSFTVVVQGVGLHGLQPSSEVLYCGNSGTTMRLMLGLLSAQTFSSTLTGDASLNVRPMARVLEPLQKTGAQFRVEHQNGQRFITCIGRTVDHPVKAIHHHSHVASAQVKSALFLSGLYALEPTTIVEPTLSRNHTEILLQHMGVEFNTRVENGAVRIDMKPTPHISPLKFTVPADISSASFFMVGALLIPQSQITILNVSVNPTRTGIIDVLHHMGAHIQLKNERELCGEKVSDIEVRFSSLVGTEIGGDVIPRLIDEIPILSLAGLCCEGEFYVRDAQELAVKETNRIEAIVKNLKIFTPHVWAYEDGLKLQGWGNSYSGLGVNQSQKVWQTFGDHRIAMMGAMANAVWDTKLVIDDTDCIRTSFPQFFDILRALSN